MASNPLRLPCNLSTTQIPSTETQNRRTVNYHHPNQWTHEIIQSLGNHLTEVERLEERARKLEENVRFMINRRDMDTLSLLQLVDDIERLGLSYKFDEDINTALQWIVSIQTWSTHQNKTLHETALSFRILRQHGFHVSQDVFKNFKDKEGNFKSEISNDEQGLLSLYEASYLSLEGESIGEANAFSRTHLMNLMKEGIEEKMVKQVKHALEGLPYHHGLRRLETSHYINIYHKTEPHHRLLLELAKLDFNMVQSLQQKELEELSRWWRDIGLASKFNFIRDRIVEIYIWSIGMYPDPRLTNCRIELAKVGQLITAVDEIYDFYGTLAKEWHILNKYLTKDSIFPKSFTQSAIDLARTSHSVYEHGDGYGIQVNIKDTIKSLLIDPIQLMCHHDDNHKVLDL